MVAEEEADEAEVEADMEADVEAEVAAMVAGSTNTSKYLPYRIQYRYLCISIPVCKEIIR